jgi:hypothetical protein
MKRLLYPIVLLTGLALVPLAMIILIHFLFNRLSQSLP